MLRNRPDFVLLVLLISRLALAECISPKEAAKHIGETKCIAGKVAKVLTDDKGVHYLQLYENTETCSFTAVIFPEDLRHIGDVRRLAGKHIEVHGEVRAYDGHAEIIVSESRQLRGEAASIPPLPKAYDVENKGRYSAGIFSHPKTYSAGKKRQPAKLPIQIPLDPEE